MDTATGTKDCEDLRFPAKMWLLINTSNSIMKWGRKGTSIIINLVRLDQYLSSEFSIFKTRSLTSFKRHMNLYGFHKHIYTEQARNSIITNICEYQHGLFKSKYPQLVSKLTCRHGHIRNHQRLPISKQARQKSLHITPTNMPTSMSSSIEKARRDFQITLQLHAENRILNQKVNESNDSSVIELSSEIYVDPFTSVSHFEPGTDYAGYYGEHISPDKIKHYFEQYLPVYEEEDDGNNNQNKDDNLWQIQKSSIIPPSTSSYLNYNKTTSNTNSETKINYSESLNHIQYSINFDPSPITVPDVAAHDNIDCNRRENPNGMNVYSEGNMHFASKILQPIYGEDSAVQCVNANNSNNVDSEDFMMDEFLKFDSSEQNKANVGDISSMKDNVKYGFKNLANDFQKSFNMLYN